VGAVVKIAGANFFVDAMSSFGVVPVDFEKCSLYFWFLLLINALKVLLDSRLLLHQPNLCKKPRALHEA